MSNPGMWREMPKVFLTLSVLPERYGICRLGPFEPLPSWAMQGPFWSVIRTVDEYSIVCAESAIPPGMTSDSGWRIFKCEGPLELELVGVMASIAAPLAEAGVSIFPLATYDTDYVLVKEVQLEAARAALIGHGHAVL